MTTRFIGHLLTGTHAARPAASAVPEGTLYSCTDHSLIYQSDTATWATWLTAGTSVSAGSNSTRVRELSTAGASTTLWSPFDHAHDGIGTITASSSNTLQRGTVNLRNGNNISFGLTDTDGDGEFDTLTIHGAAAGGGASGVTVQDEGTPLATTGTTLNFVGAGVTASGTGATKTITIAGGGSLSIPNITQVAAAGNAATSITITAAASGQRLIMFTNSTTGQVTGPACTNVTWTAVKQVDDGTGFLTIWVGVTAGGSSGTSVTMTKPGSFNTVLLFEVADALTPTLGVSGSLVTTPANAAVSTLRVASPTSGRFVVFAAGQGNTTLEQFVVPSVPSVGQPYGVGNAMVVGYATSVPLLLSAAAPTGHILVIAEIS